MKRVIIILILILIIALVFISISIYTNPNRELILGEIKNEFRHTVRINCDMKGVYKVEFDEYGTYYETTDAGKINDIEKYIESIRFGISSEEENKGSMSPTDWLRFYDENENLLYWYEFYGDVFIRDSRDGAYYMQKGAKNITKKIIEIISE